jgi:anti-sigma regulatory factor (Ser/Thr protein kinase)
MTGPAAVTTSTVPAAHSRDGHGNERDRWPLHQHLELGAVLTAPGCGRTWIRAVLQEWGLGPAADLAQLLGSELLTNAVTASARCGAAAVHLDLSSDRRRLLIVVRDFALGAPALRRPNAEDDSGRGLQIVGELAEQYGWQPPPDGGPGKVVWVLCEPLATGSLVPAGPALLAVRLPGLWCAH